MKKLHDPCLYEQRQIRIVEEIVSAVRTALSSSNVSDEALKAITEDIAFSIGAILDGSAYMPTQDGSLAPILGFAEGRSRDRLLIPREGGSSIHGLVPSCIEAAFSSQQKQDSK